MSSFTKLAKSKGFTKTKLTEMKRKVDYVLTDDAAGCSQHGPRCIAYLY